MCPVCSICIGLAVNKGLQKRSSVCVLWYVDWHGRCSAVEHRLRPGLGWYASERSQTYWEGICTAVSVGVDANGLDDC